MDFEDGFFNTSNFKLTDKLLGKGSFAEVLIVISKSDGKKYAAKIINFKALIGIQEQKNFLREITILTKIKHPAVVSFYGINLHSFHDISILEPTILMEYMQKGSLRKILNEEQANLSDNDWDPTKKYICLLGIADAMRYLHQQGILHRDLKPENILFDEDFYPKIADFGLSRCFENVLNNEEMKLTKNVGTPLYMAPELIDENSNYDLSVDVYSFAFIAYEIVTGKVPFSELGNNINFFQLSKKILNGTRPEFTDAVNEKMRNLISLCWSGDAKERPSFETIFKEMSSDLTYFVEDVDKQEIKDYILNLQEENIKEKNLSSYQIKDLERQNEIFCNRKKEESERQTYLDVTKLLMGKISNLKDLTSPGIQLSLLIRL